MIHPAFQLLLRRPELLAEHGSAYAALLAAGLSHDGRRIQRRLLCQAGALLLLAVGAVLAGTALMLWTSPAAVPQGHGTSWALVCIGVPAVPLLLAAALFWIGSDTPSSGGTLTELGRQLALDAEWLRHSGRP